jgi:alkylation response protein AidB-like acyl-CoA dehydrogenase
MNAREFVAPVAGDIRQMADQAETERRLPDALMAKLTEAGLFAIYTPRKFGGMGLPFADALQIVEEVATIDGSTAWVVSLGFTNDLFTSALTDAGATRVLGRGSALIASAPGMKVRARAVEGGYRLTGQWAFCSGAPNADWMAVPSPIFDDEQPRVGRAGPAMVVSFLPRADVEIVDNWRVNGLRATGSHDVRVNDVFVPTELTGGFGIPAGPVVVRESPLARIPMFSVLGTVQAPPVSLGVARHMIEAFKKLVHEKEGSMGGRLVDRVQTYEGVARAEALLESGRSYFYENVRKTWETVSAGCEVSLEDRAKLRLAMLTAAGNSAAAADIIYRLAGSTAIQQSSPLDRCWRDVHAAAQHAQVQDARWETSGRILLGLEPANVII